MHDLVADLVAEQEALDRVVERLSDEQWDTPSPAEGWTLRDCVVHLAEIDERAAFVARERRLPDRSGEAGDGVLTAGQLRARGVAPADLLRRWRDARAELATALLSLDPRERLPWAGPPMGARSFATARLVESWSHGLDILDAAGVEARDSDRLRHVAHMGYVTRDFAYRNRDLEPPATTLYVDLTAPSGETWTWGPPDAANRIIGSAGDFCRLVTQRIHRSDTALQTEGEDAAVYVQIAQVFAGPPGPGRPPKGEGN